jgi:hypothetical protein
MKFFLCLFLFYIFTTSLFADDLITKNGKTYKNYSLQEIKSKYIVIFYEGGIAKISHKNLTDEFKNKHNINHQKMNELKVKEKKQKQQDIIDQKNYQRKQAEKKLHKITKIFDKSVKVYEILSSSSLIAEVISGSFNGSGGRVSWTSKYIIIEDYPHAKKFVDGQVVPGNYKYKKSYLTVQGLNNFKKVTEIANDLKLFYIGPKKIIGTTYPCFTINKDKAIEYILKNPQADLSSLEHYF